jgi:hypothetical protein
VTEFYPEQNAHLEAVLTDGAIEQIRVDALEVLEIFAALTLLERFGVGECEAIVASACRSCAIAIDDSAASNHIRRAFPAVSIETTQSLVVGLIDAAVLTVTNLRTGGQSFKDVL